MKSNKVGRPEGLPKTGGRTKGTPNKITAEIREKFESLIVNNFDTLDKDLKSLKPKDRLRMIIELSKFVIPTLKAVEANIEDVTKQTVEVFEMRIMKSGEPPL